MCVVWFAKTVKEEWHLRRGSGWKIAIILAVLAAAGVFLYFTPFNLGLDLKGGVHVVLEADESGGRGYQRKHGRCTVHY